VIPLFLHHPYAAADSFLVAAMCVWLCQCVHPCGDPYIDFYYQKLQSQIPDPTTRFPMGVPVILDNPCVAKSVIFLVTPFPFPMSGCWLGSGVHPCRRLVPSLVPPETLAP
jgi:hypothetical protein